MTTLKSYDLNGKKLSFANWISNISPTETPFCSMTGKESVEQTVFQWQTDTLKKAGENANSEGSSALDDLLRATSLKSNLTQILRKAVRVSDTAVATESYGRRNELQHQMEIAVKEIKRDLEWTFLNNSGAHHEDREKGLGRETAGFHGLVAAKDAVCPETGAVVHKFTTEDRLKESDIFDLTYNLCIAGSDANIIMYNPVHAPFFSSMQETSLDDTHTTRQRIFENTPKFSSYVSTIVDPLSQEFKLIPNRWMPTSKVYFFNADDFTQMILRAPKRTKLAKDGSYEKWMIEMEVGLRLRHPFAAGVLEIRDASGNTQDHAQAGFVGEEAVTGQRVVTFFVADQEGNPEFRSHNLVDYSDNYIAPAGSKLELEFKTAPAAVNNYITASLLKDGVPIWTMSANGPGFVDCTTPVAAIPSLSVKDSGNYSLQIYRPDKGVYLTNSFSLGVKGSGSYSDPV